MKRVTQWLCVLNVNFKSLQDLHFLLTGLWIMLYWLFITNIYQDRHKLLFYKKQPFMMGNQYKGLTQTEAVLYAFTPILGS